MDLEARIATVRMAETFVISRGASDEAEVVDVELRHDGVSGFGEAAPIERYSESAASAEKKPPSGCVRSRSTYSTTPSRTRR